MRVFISWSGKRSEWIASALRDWLPNVIQSLRPFISNRDIAKGVRGISMIAKELEEAKVGIICLTEENLQAPWILFEAGALSKVVAAHVCTFLYELENSDVPSPLGQFQHTKAAEADVFALLQSINSQLGDQGLDHPRLVEAFETWWPKLNKMLNATPTRPDTETVPEKRTDDDKINELLELVRALPKTPVTSPGSTDTAYSFFSIDEPGLPQIHTFKGPFCNADKSELNSKGEHLAQKIASTTTLRRSSIIQDLMHATHATISDTGSVTLLFSDNAGNHSGRKYVAGFKKQ